MSESAVNIEAGAPKETEEEMELRHEALAEHAKKRRDRRKFRQESEKKWKNGHKEAAETLLTLNGNGGHKKCIKF